MWGRLVWPSEWLVKRQKKKSLSCLGKYGPLSVSGPWAREEASSAILRVRICFWAEEPRRNVEQSGMRRLTSQDSGRPEESGLMQRAQRQGGLQGDCCKSWAWTGQWGVRGRVGGRETQEPTGRGHPLIIGCGSEGRDVRVTPGALTGEPVRWWCLLPRWRT